MLVSLGLITRAQLDEALVAQRTSQLPVGKQLVALGAVTETRLTQVLSNQLSVPWVSLERVEFPAELLARIPPEVADRHSVLPIYVRHVRDHGSTLYVAMDDPTQESALKEIAAIANMTVRPMIAPPSEIRRVIEVRYFGASIAPPARPAFVESATGLKNLPRPAFAESATGLKNLPLPGKGGAKPPPAPSAADKAKPPRPPPPPGPAKPPKQEGLVPLEHYSTPSQPPPQAGRTLTLLDGTRIALPSTRYRGDAQEIRAVRHVIKAIRSTTEAAGEPQDEVLRWHDIVQTLLDAAAARGVKLTREEIGDAWRRQKAKRTENKAQ